MILGPHRSGKLRASGQSDNQSAGTQAFSANHSTSP